MGMFGRNKKNEIVVKMDQLVGDIGLNKKLNARQVMLDL